MCVERGGREAFVSPPLARSVVLPVALEDLRSGVEHHDLVGTAGNAGAADVDVVTAHTMVAHHADTCQHLDGVVNHFAGGLGAVVLGHAGEDAHVLALIGLPAQLVQHVHHVLDLAGHFHDHLLHQLEATDLLAELLALVGVGAGILERIDRRGDDAGHVGDALAGE